MGIYDREYFQDEGRPTGFHLGGGQPMMVTQLVVVTCGLFIVDLFMEGGLRELFRVQADVYRRPWEFWQLLSYGFAHGGFWHVALNMFMLWMFGRVVETRLGRREILLFYLAAIVVSGLAWLIATDLWLLGTAAGQAYLAENNLPAMVGASGGVTAVFLLFVLFYPRQTVYLWGLLAVPAWLIGALIIGQDLWLGLSGRSASTAWQAHLGGAAFAFLYVRFGWNFSRFVPSTIRWKWPRSSPKLRIHHDDDDDTLDVEADRVLEKLHREGERSLTARERRVLEQYSRRMRQRRR